MKIKDANEEFWISYREWYVSISWRDYKDLWKVYCMGGEL